MALHAQGLYGAEAFVEANRSLFRKTVEDIFSVGGAKMKHPCKGRLKLFLATDREFSKKSIQTTLMS